MSAYKPTLWGEIRSLLAELCLELAWRLIPKGSPQEERLLAALIPYWREELAEFSQRRAKVD